MFELQAAHSSKTKAVSVRIPEDVYEVLNKYSRFKNRKLAPAIVEVLKTAAIDFKKQMKGVKVDMAGNVKGTKKVTKSVKKATTTAPKKKGKSKKKEPKPKKPKKSKAPKSPAIEEVPETTESAE